MLLTKYGLAEVEGVDKNVMRLTNQLWKLIPMREHEENWLMQLDSLIVEIAGLNEIFKVQGTNAWYELTPEELLKGYDFKCECGCNTLVKETDKAVVPSTT